MRYHTKGAGLGLTISQRLASMMGSHIQVQSTVGQGSTFWFEVELPETEGELVSPTKPYQYITGFRNLRSMFKS